MHALCQVHSVLDVCVLLCMCVFVLLYSISMSVCIGVLATCARNNEHKQHTFCLFLRTQVVYNLVVGGYFSLKRNIMSIPTDISVTHDQMVAFNKALLEVFRWVFGV